jgi:hypothetical protein
VTSRADIETGRLVYTCNCGFVDTGHANPGGAKKLLDDITHERHVVDHRLNNHHTIEGRPCFVINYHQGMGTKQVKVLAGSAFLIRKGLSKARRIEVALAIFMDVTVQFEAMQSNKFWSLMTDSGFSVEDLMSNLISFHRAVDDLSMEVVRQECGVVSAEAALAVYDASLSGGIGAVKTRDFLKPAYFPCDACKDPPALPKRFTAYKPAAYDGDYIRLPDILPFRPFSRSAIDFDRFGNPR